MMVTREDIQAEAITVWHMTGEPTIQRMESLLAWRSPNDKPMGHIVLERDAAQQLVNAWRNIFGPAPKAKPAPRNPYGPGDPAEIDGT